MRIRSYNEHVKFLTETKTNSEITIEDVKALDENFEYFIMDNEVEVPVSKEEFIKYGTPTPEEAEKLSIEFNDNRVVGRKMQREF